MSHLKSSCWKSTYRRCGERYSSFLCAELNLSVEDVFRSFGRHRVLFTTESAYGDLLEETGDTIEGAIMNLYALRRMIGQSMPDLRPPSFDVRDVEDGSIVESHSERSGLEAMVIGILDGLLEMFEQKDGYGPELLIELMRQESVHWRDALSLFLGVGFLPPDQRCRYREH